jgi:hypothetical protein
MNKEGRTDSTSKFRHLKPYMRILIGRRMRWLFVLVFLPAVALFVVPKVYRKLETLRVREQMSKFDSAIAEDNIEEASNFLKVVEVLRPGSPDAQRGVRILNAAQGSPSALVDTQRLMELNSATPQELLILADQALNRNMPEVAATALRKYDGDPSTRRTVLEIRLKRLEGQNAEAMELAKSAAASAPDADEADKILLEGGAAGLDENFSAGSAILYPISLKPNQTGLDALRLLAAYAMQHPNDSTLPFQKLANSIRDHTLHGGLDLLAAADLDLVHEPKLKEGLVGSLVRDFANAPKDSALAFAEWLIFYKEYQAAIDFIREKRAVSEDVWFFPYLVALARLENWEEMNLFLRGWNLPLTAPSLRLLFLAHAAEKNGDEERAKGLWSELEIRCINEPAPFARLLVETAWKFGHPEEAKRLAWALARNKETSAEGFRLVINQQPTSSSSREWIPIYQEMLEYLPDSPTARRGLAYHQLMAEENVPQAAEIALAEHKKSPNKRATCHLAALALLRLGEIAQADALYDALPLRKNAPAAKQAIRVAILRKMNRSDQADALTATIDSAKLNPEEQMLLALP